MVRERTFHRRTVLKSAASVSAVGLLAGCVNAPQADTTTTTTSDGAGTTNRPTQTTEATTTGGSPTATETTQDGGGSSGGKASFGGWMKDVSNYTGVVDKTGQESVTVKVGVNGNSGAFAFGPPVVRVDSGTTVTWKWTGKGGTHNVAAKNGSFASEIVSTAGHTFEQQFTNSGEVKYFCDPHRSVGMKGVVVVE